MFNVQLGRITNFISLDRFKFQVGDTGDTREFSIRELERRTK